MLTDTSHPSSVSVLKADVSCQTGGAYWATHHTPAKDFFDEVFGAGEASGVSVDVGLCALAAGAISELGALHRPAEEGVAQVGGDPETIDAAEPASEGAVAGLDLAGEVAAVALGSVGWGDAVPEAEAPSAGPAPAPAEPPPPPPLPDGAMAILGAPAGWTKTPQGYIFSPEHRRAGRLTAWGKSVSMKCGAHTKCSLAKGRAVATVAQLIAWLALAHSDDALSDAPKHLAAWRRIESATASSSSA